MYLGVTCASLMVVTPVLYIMLCDGAKLIQLYFFCAYTMGRVKGWCSSMRSGELVAGLRDICFKVAYSNLYWKIRCIDCRFSKFLTHSLHTNSIISLPPFLSNYLSL